MLPSEEFGSAVERFFHELIAGPFKEYISGVADDADESGQFLNVFIKQPLPDHLKLPDTYEGLRVRVTQTGPFEPFGSD